MLFVTEKKHIFCKRILLSRQWTSQQLVTQCNAYQIWHSKICSATLCNKWLSKLCTVDERALPQVWHHSTYLPYAYITSCKCDITVLISPTHISHHASVTSQYLSPLCIHHITHHHNNVNPSLFTEWHHICMTFKKILLASFVNLSHVTTWVLYSCSLSFLIHFWQNDMHATEIIAKITDDVYDNDDNIDNNQPEDHLWAS